jgi:presequence protease
MLRAASSQWRARAARPLRYATTSGSVRKFTSSAALELQRGDGCAALQVGEQYHNFTLLRKQRVPEYNIDALELEHSRTKAKYLHIDAKDTNNVFSVMFRTPPYSSNGIAHILEHTVLCGSQKYPVRDPFFNMIKRSLNTYMNAMTAYDHTMYPFSTVNQKDLENLRSVYLDAVFFPKLERLDFLQEGHRLEIVPDKKTNELDLQYKGVVYNEMKGVMSDAHNLFGTRIQEALLDGTIYGHVSGGLPAHIPELTYGELKTFHAKHYHPSNACFYSYGDMPLTDHLQYLDEEILAKFEYREDSAAVRVDSTPFEIRRASESSTPTLLVVDGPTSNMAAQSERDPNLKFCMSQFLDVSSTDAFATFVWRIIGYLLTSGPSSPLYKALIESQLAQDFSVGTGFDASTFYSTFGVGVEGIEGEDAIPQIQQAVADAYASVVADGFERDRVEALLHQLELTQKHIVGNFGMNLMHGLSSVWTHRGDLLENLQLNPLLERLHSEMDKNPHFLEHHVRDHLLKNDQFKEVHVLMKPTDKFVKDQEAREAEQLATLLMKKTNSDLEHIAATTKALEAYQKKQQPVELLPTLTLADIPTKLHADDVESIDKVFLGKGGAVQTEFVKVATTNGLSYVRLLYDTTRLPLAYHQYIPLFTSVIGSLGTSRLKYDVLPTAIQNCSGGISCSGLTHPSLFDAATSSTQSVLLGTLCLPHKMDETLQILYEILSDTQFLDTDNLKQLRIILQMAAANASNTLSSSGASFASKRARVGFTDSAVYDELYGGVTHVEQLQQWAHASDDQLREIATILQSMARAVFTADNLRLSVVTEDALRSDVEAKLEQHLLHPLASGAGAYELPTLDGHALPSLSPSPKTFYGLPISVNFVVETLPSVAFAHPDHVPLSVLAQIMSSCFLHQQVREKGGAYGSGVSQGEGAFSLSSHYDPNTFDTLTAYEKTLAWAANGSFSDRDIQEALLSIFSSIDAPKTPSMKGKMSFLRGITNDMRQQRREQYLQLTKTQLVDVAQHYFNEKPPSHVVIIGKESETKAMKKAFFDIQKLTA